jgi:hypothetical protein
MFESGKNIKSACTSLISENKHNSLWKIKIKFIILKPSAHMDCVENLIILWKKNF